MNMNICYILYIVSLWTDKLFKRTLLEKTIYHGYGVCNIVIEDTVMWQNWNSTISEKYTYLNID